MAAHPQGQVRIFCTSIIVAAKLSYGAAKKASVRLAGEVEACASHARGSVYGTLRCQLERVVGPIGNNGRLIAAQAIAPGYTIVTDKVNSPRSRIYLSKMVGLAAWFNP